MKETRCSSLPLAFICPPSLHDVDVRIDHTGEPAGIGTAVHRALAPLVDGMSPQAALDVALDVHRDADRAEVAPLFWAGVKIWENKLRAMMPGARAEIALSATVSDGESKITLSGHVDNLSVDHVQRTAVVNDWKTGRLDHDFSNQGFGYAALVLLNDPDVDLVSVYFSWVRTGEVEAYIVTRERMNQWLESLMGEVIKWDGRYHDGPHCSHCHRNHACPAATAMVRRDVQMFADGGSPDIQAMDDSAFAAYWRKLKALETMVKEAREHARIEVDRRGGEVEDDAGGVIHFVDQNGPREIDWLKARPIVEGILKPEEYVEALSVSAKKLDDIVGKKAGRGKGAAAKRDLAEKLEAAGAVSHTSQRKLVEERIK